MDRFLELYARFLQVLAKVTVHTLEIFGISIVVLGTVKVLLHHVKRLIGKRVEHQNAVITLGRSLSLALEFKMGAEIVNTVIVRELKELLILGIIIVLRAILAIIIHWEITTEEKEERAHTIARENAIKKEADEKGRRAEENQEENK